MKQLLDYIIQQLFSDVRDLVQSLGSNSTRGPCCFQARNITVVNLPFETDMNPLPAIEDIFVSLPACNQLVPRFLYSTLKMLTWIAAMENT